LLRISQVNNSYIFPGLALGILISKASRVTDRMIMAAARMLASLSPARLDPTAPLLPPLKESRAVGLKVGDAVARQAIADGVSSLDPAEVPAALAAYVWDPVYQPYERLR